MGSSGVGLNAVSPYYAAMDDNPMQSLIQALLLGLVEGATEFLPISSTGHLILANSLLPGGATHSVAFTIAIQTGAVSAVVWLYFSRFWGLLNFRPGADGGRAGRLRLNLIVAFLPSAILGLLLSDWISALLFHPVPVAIALIVGGLVILWAESRPAAAPTAIADIDAMRWTDALKIGLAQAFALIPGTSRSGATIIGAMLMGYPRRLATEFSFFLAVPTLYAAGAYSVMKEWSRLTAADLPLFAVGTVAAFASALVVVRWLIGWVSRNPFTVFAYYRIGFGLLVLATAYFGVIDWSDPDAGT